MPESDGFDSEVTFAEIPKENQVEQQESDPSRTLMQGMSERQRLWFLFCGPLLLLPAFHAALLFFSGTTSTEVRIHPPFMSGMFISTDADGMISAALAAKSMAAEGASLLALFFAAGAFLFGKMAFTDAADGGYHGNMPRIEQGMAVTMHTVLVGAAAAIAYVAMGALAGFLPLQTPRLSPSLIQIGLFAIAAVAVLVAVRIPARMFALAAVDVAFGVVVQGAVLVVLAVVAKPLLSFAVALAAAIGFHLSCRRVG